MADWETRYLPTVIDVFEERSERSELEILDADDSDSSLVQLMDDGDVNIQLHARTPKKNLFPVSDDEVKRGKKEKKLTRREIIVVEDLDDEEGEEEQDASEGKMSLESASGSIPIMRSFETGFFCSVPLADSDEENQGGDKSPEIVISRKREKPRIGSPEIVSPLRQQKSGVARVETKRRKKSKTYSHKKTESVNREQQAIDDKKRKTEEKVHYREMQKQLFEVERKKLFVEKKVRKVAPPKPAPEVKEVSHVDETIYQIARRKLQTQNGVTGRETEMAQILEFATNLLQSKSHGACFVCGPSGVGKSLTVSQVSKKLVESKLLKHVYTINLETENISCLLTYLAELLMPKKMEENDSIDSKIKARNVIEESAKHKPILIVLEEVDNKTHLKSVCELFHIANSNSSQLVLIGIGNQRSFVSQNKLAVNLEVLFVSYSAEKLVEIVREKMTPEITDKLFDSMALKLWSTKVAETMGDLRRAVAFLSRTLDCAECDHLGPKPDAVELSKGEDVTKVTLKTVQKVLSTWNSTEDALTVISGLAPQARLVLMGIAKQTNGEFTENDLRRVYCSLLHHDRPDEGELKALLSSLLDTPFVVANGDKYGVRLDSAIMSQAIAGDSFLSTMLK